MKDSRRSYFIKQKLTGVIVVLAAILLGLLLDFSRPLAIIMLPMGLMLIFSKKMILTDASYYEMMNESNLGEL